jgi:hypothetical protein
MRSNQLPVHAKWLVFLGSAFLFLSTSISNSVPVPNSSFEEGQGNNPTGWRFSGTRAAEPRAWTTEQPFDGNRALRLDAHDGSVRWESKQFPIKASQKYLLQWHARFRGEKIWRFRADFCGVQVLFRDKAGQIIDSTRQHTSCWATRGWQPGWFLFSAPAKAKSIGIRFAIETTNPLPGGFDVDNVELDEWPPAAAPVHSKVSLLSLKLEDEQGRPLGARIRIENSRGEAMRPPGAISYEKEGGVFHPLEEGASYLFLPKGVYSISATRGFEYEPWESQVEIKKQLENVTIRLRRAWDWRQHGWFAGDHHTHLFRHGGSLFPSLQWPDVLRAARCEGLDFLPFMGADSYPSQKGRVSETKPLPRFAYELTEEITEDFWGHVCPIGATAESRRDLRYKDGPMHFDRYAAMAGFGGVLSYGHPYGPLEKQDDLEPVAKTGMGHVAREFPIDLALGVPCAMDLLAMEGPQNQLDNKLRDLYRLWNLGFRPVVAASTDFHVDQGRQPIGSVRTYVRSGSLDMPAIAHAYRAGHTFATSGPLIDLQVGGAGPGDELRLPISGLSAQVKVDSVSIGRLERVELIVNGKILKTFTSADPHRISFDYNLKAEQSFWIAARVYGSKERFLASELEGRPLGVAQFAHTTPVYVLIEDKPIFAARAEDAQYFVRWCDAVLTAWAGEDPVIKERLIRARNAFQELGSRGH